MITKWGVALPEAGNLPALPRGVVLHWTGGGPRANEIDLAAYHYVVEADGQVEQGKYSVATNMRRIVGGPYARHTGGWNSFHVGVAGAGMRNYQGRSHPGDSPLTEEQVRRMCEIAAHFLAVGGLDPFNPLHLCTHLEVWTIHGVKGTQNHQKLDIEFLPFKPELSRSEIGPFLRKWTAEIMAESAPAVVPEVEPKVVELAKEAPDVDPPNLAYITHPKAEHVERIVKLRGVSPEAARVGMEVAEVLMRRVLTGQVGNLKEVADAAADWLKSRL